jgi:hypothetical protein
LAVRLAGKGACRHTWRIVLFKGPGRLWCFLLRRLEQVRCSRHATPCPSQKRDEAGEVKFPFLLNCIAYVLKSWRTKIVI